MRENKISEETTNQSKENIQKEAKSFFVSVKIFLIELFDFRNDTDYGATIESIKADIPFKGATAWILIFAIFVASFGLNVNSTAVVIGAMLISPLMGPILGVGMSIAINDIDTLKKSLINLLTMILLSLITAFLFFYIFPLSEDNSELLGRVRPDIRDVLIAFFSGLALMVAKTKKGTIASVIFGVAIATALMPPLCTAGFGLAQGNWEYFFGAMYLFLINTIFIGLATFLVLKLLNFPMLKYVNSVKRKRIAQLASVVAFVVMIPAILTFIKVYKENGIKTHVSAFIKNEIKSNPSLQLIDHETDLQNKIISVNFFNEVTQATENDLKNKLKNNNLYFNLKGFTLNIRGSDTKSFELITSAYKEKREELQKSKNIIEGLQKDIADLQKTISLLNTRIEQDALNKNKKSVAFSTIVKEAKIRYKNIEEIGFGKILFSKNFIEIDTIPQVFIRWNTKLKENKLILEEKELRGWLQKQMGLDTLFIKRRNK